MVTRSDDLERLKQPVEAKDGVAGIERPNALHQLLDEDPQPLLEMAHRHLVSARQISRRQLVQLCRLAAAFEMDPVMEGKPLEGKLLITAFYEPSTRTRLSFESAWHRLGGDVIPITDASTTGIAKGESLRDVAEMLSNYGDVVVLRDSSEDSVERMVEALRIPIINAGNGIDEHPTQALADLYAIFKWCPQLALPAQARDHNVRIGIIGTPRRMRTVRSLLLLLRLIAEGIREVTIINPESDLFDPGQREELEEAGLRIRASRRLKDVLPQLDVVYINSIAWIGDTYETLTGDLKLSADSPLKPGAIVLHPLARGDELDTDLDPTPHNWYFAQARGAVFVRMALLTVLMQRVYRVADAPLPTKAKPQ
ncbi:MAG TPA: aspartate carbamoyltransferase [Acidobacteriota bacterium]|nr:aspartate carbamoyltransferase [Acidobacteriota bacterium]